MTSKLLQALVPVLLRSVLPAGLATAGTMAAVLWSEGFRAFCGLQ